MRRTTGGRTGGKLLLAAGVLTLVNNYLPGSDHLDLAVLNTVALVAVSLGGICLVVPWDRLPLRAPLLVLVAALALLSVSGVYGGVGAYSYAVYYVVVFVWVGLTQPPGTSLWVAPSASFAYLLPFLVDSSPPETAIGSVTVAIPVCVLVGEVLSRSVSRLEDSRLALTARAEHEEAVVDALADGVLVLDARGRVRSCNAVAAGLLGTARDQLVGTVPPLEVGPPGIALHHSVGAHWVETVATELEATGERVVVLRDISRQRALDEAKDLFLATTSHELRTPLTAIKGYVHVLERRWDVIDEDRRRQALATIADRTDALVALTDHLLLGARAGASRHSGDARPFPLVEGLEATVRGFEGVSERHRLVLDAPDEPLVGLGDPSSVHHVVTQLLENAVKYSPDGGTVTVSVRREQGFAAVEVTDEGIGVPEGDEESLFTPFFQAGATNTREYGGVGLGLYIVRQLVEAQGGNVRAQNRPGGGAVVRFTVPLSAQPPCPRAGDLTALAGPRRS
ncbi:MAG: multi-sensor signal transduction histidine kinase [Frankiales bacterium]|nr:multi-sensor signal transduction histidine kinase [Frankiales bacterium]